MVEPSKRLDVGISLSRLEEFLRYTPEEAVFRPLPIEDLARPTMTRG